MKTFYRNLTNAVRRGPLLYVNQQIIFFNINLTLFFSIDKAEIYKNKGNHEYSKKNFSNAIHFYTEGIKVNCKDDELNAKLYSNRATAYLYLGKSSKRIFQYVIVCRFSDLSDIFL